MKKWLRFLAGIIDKTGRFCDNVPSPRFRTVDKQVEFVFARAMWLTHTAGQ